MPAAISPGRELTAPDDLDDLFNYDAGVEEAAHSGITDSNGASNSTAFDPAQTSTIDEEIIVTKRRQPIAKLDETRILSAAGIPRLRKISKKLRFKGKGHEFSDMSRVLHMYQLWLDELYPRAKFADGLAIIEKLGHKKTMQMQRKGWIDEGKPIASHAEVDSRIEDETASGSSATLPPPAYGESLNLDEDGGTAQIPPYQPPTAAHDQSASNEADDHQQEEPEDDELDALMAEAQEPSVPQEKKQETELFADEEEAMAGMEW